MKKIYQKFCFILIIVVFKTTINALDRSINSLTEETTFLEQLLSGIAVLEAIENTPNKFGHDPIRSLVKINQTASILENLNKKIELNGTLPQNHVLLLEEKTKELIQALKLLSKQKSGSKSDTSLQRQIQNILQPLIKYYYKEHNIELAVSRAKN